MGGVSQTFAQGLTSRFLANNTAGKLLQQTGAGGALNTDQLAQMLPAAASGFGKGLGASQGGGCCWGGRSLDWLASQGLGCWLGDGQGQGCVRASQELECWLEGSQTLDCVGASQGQGCLPCCQGLGRWLRDRKSLGSSSLGLGCWVRATSR